MPPDPPRAFIRIGSLKIGQKQKQHSNCLTESHTRESRDLHIYNARTIIMVISFAAATPNDNRDSGVVFKLLTDIVNMIVTLY